MKAISRSKFGPPSVLSLQELEKPIPNDNEVLIKVYASSINSADWRLLEANPWFVRLMGEGFFRPKQKILGTDVAGVVESTGKNVTKFKPGDAVVGDIENGGYAEFVAVSQDLLVKKPPNITFEEAGVIPLASITALKALREIGEIKAGESVLVNGAGGGVGHFAVQIAKALGAEVTAVTRTEKVEILQNYADFVIDYKKEDCTKNGKKYDLIVDAGAYKKWTKYRDSFSENGRYVLIGGSMKRLMQAGMARDKRIKTFVSMPDIEKLQFVMDLAEKGKITPYIDTTFLLEQIPEAMEYFKSGKTTGKISIKVIKN